jgi:cytochrome c
MLRIAAALLCLSPTAVERGRAFVKTHCAQCHAIGRSGASPMALAPAFRHLNRRYDPLQDLAEAFAEGIITGHRTMPGFRLDRRRIRDVMAYLHSLEQ